MDTVVTVVNAISYISIPNANFDFNILSHLYYIEQN